MPKVNQSDFTRLLALSLVLLGPLAAPTPGSLVAAQAQAEDPFEPLLKQGRTFYQRGRIDKAAEAYQKVLRSKPDHPEALEMLGLWHAHAGRLGPAKEMLAALERVAPGGGGAARLRAALNVGSDFESLVDQARKAVRAGDLKAASALYRRAFGGATPPDGLAVEYYQTLGGTESGWDEARKGLEQFAKDHQGLAQAQLAFAQHLTYRERSRRDGIDRLAALSKQPRLRGEATAAWRQALLWLQADEKDADRFSTYLSSAGSDAEVEKRLASLGKTTRRGKRGQTVAAGFEALERDDTAEAIRQFERAGDAPEALTGLALVAMSKEDFDLAVELLEKVRARAKKKTDLWEKPLRSALFWQKVKAAEKLAEAADAAQAEPLLREAITENPEEAHHAQIALANLLREGGDLGGAEQELSAALEKSPENPDVLRALVDVALETNAFDAAIEKNLALRKLDPDKAWPERTLAAEILRRRALEQRAAGALDTAYELLSQAESSAPKLYWVRHDLADLELERGRTQSARAHLRALLQIDAKQPAGRLLSARVSGEQGEYAVGLEALSGLPDTALAGRVGELRRELSLRAEIDSVVRKSEKAGHYAALREMLRLARKVDGAPPLMAHVALGLADIGEGERAVNLLQDALALTTRADSGLSLQLAAIYLRTGDDSALRDLLESLASDPSLSPRAQRDLARLHVAFAVSTADRLVQRGEHKRAFAQLEPLLSEYPDDASLLCGLGRLFLATGDYPEAGATFAQVLSRDPKHLEAREGAIAAARARGDAQHAERLVQEGLEIGGNQARMHLIAARHAALRGDDAKAMQQLVKARTLTEHAAPSRAGAGGDMVPTETSGLVERARERLGDERALSAAEGRRLAETIDEEIHKVRQRHSVGVTARPSVRYRAGEEGLGQLFELTVPASLSIPLGYFGKLELGAAMVRLASGDAALDNADLASRFGSIGTVAGVTVPRVQDDVGVAPRLSLHYKDQLQLQVGTTPLGFVYHSLVGGLRFEHRWERIAIAAHAEREAVTDSLLSYAGTTDPLTGETWGGVTAQGGGLELSFGREALYYYLGGGYHLLKGRRVADNRRATLSTGLSWLLYDWDAHTVRLGFTIYGAAFRRDLSRFSLGHGGYFSPQLFGRMGVPLRWGYGGERLRGLLNLDPGLNWFRRETSLYYPSHPRLQAEREDLGLVATYAGGDNFGFSLNVRGDLTYRVARGLDLGAYASMHFANDYEEYRAGAFLELSFRRRVRKTEQEK